MQQLEHLPVPSQRSQRPTPQVGPSISRGVAPAISDLELRTILAQHMVGNGRVGPVATRRGGPPGPGVQRSSSCRISSAAFGWLPHQRGHEPPLCRVRLRIGLVALSQEPQHRCVVAAAACQCFVQSVAVPGGQLLATAGESGADESVRSHGSSRCPPIVARWISGATKVESNSAARRQWGDARSQSCSRRPVMNSR